MGLRTRGTLPAALALSSMVVSAAAPVGAQVCFSTPVTLPGLSGPPDWEAPGTTRDELNEPRWAGAPQTGFASDPTGAEGLYRVMVNSTFTELSVSFQAPTDPNTPSNSDTVYFGFTTDGTTGGLARGVAISMPHRGARVGRRRTGEVEVQVHHAGRDRSAAGPPPGAVAVAEGEPAGARGDLVGERHPGGAVTVERQDLRPAGRLAAAGRYRRRPDIAHILVGR
jgi:hypothetical protein